MTPKIELYIPAKIKVINLILYTGALVFGFWISISIFNKFNFDGNPQPDLGWLLFSIVTGLIIVIGSIYYLLKTIKSFRKDRPVIVIDHDGIQLNNANFDLSVISWDEIKNIRLSSQILSPSPSVLIEVADIDKFRNGTNIYQKHNFWENCIVMQTTFLSVNKKALVEELQARLEQERIIEGI